MHALFAALACKHDALQKPKKAQKPETCVMMRKHAPCHTVGARQLTCRKSTLYCLVCSTPSSSMRTAVRTAAAEGDAACDPKSCCTVKRLMELTLAALGGTETAAASALLEDGAAAARKLPKAAATTGCVCA